MINISVRAFKFKFFNISLIKILWGGLFQVMGGFKNPVIYYMSYVTREKYTIFIDSIESSLGVNGFLI